MISLSIICPSIRKSRLGNLYNTIEKSFDDTFEFIVIGPHSPDFTKNNMRWIEDWGSAVRCQQIGLCEAKGNYITRAVDDSVYLPNTLSKALDKLEDIRCDDGRAGNIIGLKYTETNASVDRTHPSFQNMNDPKFYDLTYHHQTLKPYVPAGGKILNFSIMSLALLKEVGGWDCQFESVAIAELDLAIRLQMHGAEITLSDDIALECDWMPGHQGDHGPMHDCFAPDMDKYSAIYSKPECEDRVIIDIDNWKNSPSRWERRFKK